MNRRFRIFLVVMLTWVLAGCAGNGGQLVKIDTAELQGRQNMPDELTYMLRSLGYDWIPLADPNSGAGVRYVQQGTDNIMLFRHNEAQQVRIGVRISLQDGSTRLRMYEIGSRTLGPSAQELLRQLQTRTVSEFGASNVRY